MKKFLYTLTNTVITMALVWIISESSGAISDAYWWLYDWIDTYMIIDTDATMLFIIAVIAALIATIVDRVDMFMRRVEIHIELKPAPAKEKVAKPVKA